MAENLLIWRVALTILRNDGPVGNDDDGPLELVFEVLNHPSTDLSEGSQGSEGNSDEDVLGSGAVSELVLDLLGVREHKLLDVGEVLGLALLVGNEALGNNFLQLGVLLVLPQRVTTRSHQRDLRSS